VTDTAPQDNKFIANTIVDNGGNPSPDYPLPGSDTVFFGDTSNCAKGNNIGVLGLGGLLPKC
jgi:hypothetical protein